MRIRGCGHGVCSRIVHCTGRALAMNPKLLILDEPTEGIQPSIIKDIERAIRSLADSGVNWRLYKAI